MKNLIAIIIILLAGWLLYTTFKDKWDSPSLAESEFVSPPDAKFISEDGKTFYTVLNNAWHNPQEEESLSTLIDQINNIEEEKLKEHFAITAAIGCRLQERKQKYRKIESFLDAAYPHGTAERVLTRSYLGETCTRCQGNGNIEGECDNCEGTGECQVSRCENGEIPFEGFGGRRDSYPCLICDGAGECQDCLGTGTTVKQCPRCRGSGTEAITDESVKNRYREFITDTINYAADQGKFFTQDVIYREGKLIIQ